VSLRYSPRARTDIARIHDYISQHNQNAAIAVVQRIRSTCELLARFPGLGRDADISAVRVFPIARYPYVIYHRFKGDELEIVHIRDGRRDRPREGEL
jgi:toxin ParE1/3/4